MFKYCCNDLRCEVQRNTLGPSTLKTMDVISLSSVVLYVTKNFETGSSFYTENGQV